MADSTGLKIAARAAQGAGAALIAPSALTLLMMLFGSEPKELMRAFAVYGAAAPAGGTAGVFLGGVITEWISWPWVFYVNIPIALAVLALTPGVMPSAPARRGSIDILGALTATAGLGLTVFGIVRAPEEGWESSAMLLAIGGGLALLAAFVAVQASRREPLMRLSILRTPNLAAANLAQMLLGAAWIPMWFFLNLYLQRVLGFGAFEGSAALLPMTAAIMLLMVVVAPKVIARLGAKTPIVVGMLLLAAGMAVMSLVRANGSFAVDVLPASLIAAAGMSLVFIPSLGTAISSAKPEEGGLASGIVNTSYQVGSALGLAVMTAVATSQGADRLGNAIALTEGLLNRGNLAAAEQLVHPEFLNHEAAKGRPRGPEGMRQTVSWLHDAFAQLNFTVHDVIAEGDKVVVRCVMSGRHTGELMGLPPTGQSFSVQHIHIFRIADGKLVEHWANRDDMGAMTQLGLTPELHNHR